MIWYSDQNAVRKQGPNELIDALIVWNWGYSLGFDLSFNNLSQHCCQIPRILKLLNPLIKVTFDYRHPLYWLTKLNRTLSLLQKIKIIQSNDITFPRKHVHRTHLLRVAKLVPPKGPGRFRPRCLLGQNLSTSQPISFVSLHMASNITSNTGEIASRALSLRDDDDESLGVIFSFGLASEKKREIFR